MERPCIAILDRHEQIVGAEPRLWTLLGAAELPVELELLIRHATAGWRSDPATCRETAFTFGGALAVRVFPLMESGHVRVGLFLERVLGSAE